MKQVQKNYFITVVTYCLKFCNVNKVVFELFQKLHLQIYASQFLTEIIPLPFVVLNIESVEKKGKNYKNLNISRSN